MCTMLLCRGSVPIQDMADGDEIAASSSADVSDCLTATMKIENLSWQTYTINEQSVFEYPLYKNAANTCLEQPY